MRAVYCFKSFTLLTKPPGLPSTRLNNMISFKPHCPPVGLWQISIRASQPDGPLSPIRAQKSMSRAGAMPSSGPPRTREPSPPHPLTTVVQLGMSLIEFFTSSSVTSTTLQCSSSEGRGSSPPLVTQGCTCGVGRAGRGQTDDTPSAKDHGHSTSNHLEGIHSPQTPNLNPIYFGVGLSRRRN